jgi:uncharacterized protein YdeI (YjbR/CyaY-like superfamily)
MAKGKTNSQVDRYFSTAKKWREELTKLRTILLDFPLIEELKWGKPCYTLNGRNVVLAMGFKNHCILLFCKGALLKDPKKILVKAGEETQAARQARFTRLSEIVEKEPSLKACIREAIEAEKAGLEVKFKKIEEHKVPEEFQKQLDKDSALKKAFAALTPGRRRGYLMHFSSAKQSETREVRIDKCRPQILKGIGFNEEYRQRRK